MDPEAKAKKIGYDIGLLFVIGIIAFGAQLHRFFPFIGPAVGIGLLLLVLHGLGKVYGKSNAPRLEGLEGDELLMEQVRIAKVIRWFMVFFVALSILSFFVV